MSGISGIIDWTGRPVPRSALEAMLEAARHRGPDGRHAWIGDGVALGHLTLRVTPEEQNEQQPIVENGVVFTGAVRLDNRAELIAGLGDGIGPASNPPSDARLIVAAYRRWGAECVSRLIGDFAFVLFDTERRRVLAARDPMAMRPLYYRHSGERFLFASEIAQLLTQPEVPAALDERMVGAFLAGQPAPLDWTFYQGIAQLPPGYAMLVEPERQCHWRLWDIDPDHRISYRSGEEYAEHFLELFKEAVRCRLRSTRPVGLLLSGGMDSGAIGATAGWLLEHEQAELPVPRLHTYCWEFRELPQCDERHLSRVTTGRYRLPTTDVLADDAYPLSGFPEHGPHRDEPMIGIYQSLYEKSLSLGRADGVAMVMSGDRGDLVVGEAVFDLLGLLTGGYWRELMHELGVHRRTSGQALPTVLRRRLLLPLLFALWPRGVLEGVRRRAWARSNGRRRIPSTHDWLDPAFLDRVGLNQLITPVEAPGGIRNAAIRNRYEMIFIEQHMRGMVWSERTQAGFGLGFADPWSDRRLSEFVLAVPQFRVHRLSDQKRLVRQAMLGIMPEAARLKAGKTSPAPLYHGALRQRARHTVLTLLTNSEVAARGYMVEEKVRDFYESVCRGERSANGLWEILALEMWLRRYWN